MSLSGSNGLHSRQIRPPIYSMKQSKLRRRRVIRYAILYFVLLAVFIGLIVGPIVAGKQIPKDVLQTLGQQASFGGLFRLMQPNGQDNDNTKGRQETGTGRPNYSGAFTRSTTRTGGAAPTAGGNNRIKLF